MSTASHADDGLGATAQRTWRMGLFLIAAAVGVGLALLSSRVSAPDISSLADLQELLTSSPTSAGSIAAVGIAFLIGASMVVLPCGFPSVFMVPSILNSRPRFVQKAALTVIFLGGSAPLLALAGLVLSYVGDGILSLVSTQRSKMLTSAVLYSLMGLTTLGYALSSLGFLRLPTLQARVTGPRLPGKDRPYRRSFLLGATFGGGMGIACPMPTYYLILGWVVATASPLYGTVLMASYGLGRVAPALAIGALLAGGANRRVVSRRMAWVQEHIESPIALVMGATGAYLLVFFGGVVGFRAL